MASWPQLSPINRTTITDEIVKRLVDLILAQGLKPGDKLPPERELTSLLAVGRSSLREAVKTLSALGAIEVRIGEGMFVGDGSTSLLTKPLSWGLLLSERSATEVIEARRCVEVELAGYAAARATRGELALLKRELDGMSATLEDPAAYAHHDLSFHLTVGQMAHNRVLYQILQTLRHVLKDWIAKNISDFEEKPLSLGEHVPIYEAIQARDVEQARRAMAAHLDEAGARLLSVVGSGGPEVELGDAPFEDGEPQIPYAGERPSPRG